MAWVDGLLKLAMIPADSLPGRLGRRIRRVRMDLRKAVSTQITVLQEPRRPDW